MNALTCDELSELIADFLSGELAVEVRAQFTTHVDGCTNCGKSVDLYRLTIKVTRALPKADPLPPSVEQRLRAAMAVAAAVTDGDKGE